MDVVPPRLPKSRSLASYDDWKQYERENVRKNATSCSDGSDSDTRPTSPRWSRSPSKRPQAPRREGSKSSENLLAVDLSNGSSVGGSQCLGGGQYPMNTIVDEDGITEYATLELRVHPPTVKVDNTLDDEATVVIVDSANRPGTLVEVVQNLTELGLDVCRAQISSDGGWFVDVFHVKDSQGCKIVDERTLSRIENMLDLNFDIAPGVPSGGQYIGMNIVEIVAKDKPGLLSQVSRLITNTCHLDIYDSLLCANGGCAAILLTASESGQPLSIEGDQVELENRIRDLLGPGDASCPTHVHVDCCFDALALETRFYRLKMTSLPGRAGATRPNGRASGNCGCATKVSLRFDPSTSYTTLHITSRDRPQLLFDAVCTLSDLSIDVFHATIDTSEEIASLEFFVKSTSGSEIRLESDMARIRDALGRALELGPPQSHGKNGPGDSLCLHRTSAYCKGSLPIVSGHFHEAGLTIAYCTMRTDPVEKKTCSTYYLTSSHDGSPAEMSPKVKACMEVVGAKAILVPSPTKALNGTCKKKKDSGKSGGEFLETLWNKLWLGMKDK